MTKTIEEAAAEYAGEFCTKHNLYHPELLQVIADAYKASAERIMSLPLASRLTAEEKERVRGIYNEELGMAQHFHLKAKASSDISCRQHYYGLREPYISRMKLLERIFGSDFFKEGE